VPGTLLCSHTLSVPHLVPHYSTLLLSFAHRHEGYPQRFLLDNRQ